MTFVHDEEGDLRKRDLLAVDVIQQYLWRHEEHLMGLLGHRQFPTHGRRLVSFQKVDLTKGDTGIWFLLPVVKLQGQNIL